MKLRGGKQQAGATLCFFFLLMKALRRCTWKHRVSYALKVGENTHLAGSRAICNWWWPMKWGLARSVACLGSLFHGLYYQPWNARTAKLTGCMCMCMCVRARACVGAWRAEERQILHWIRLGIFQLISWSLHGSNLQALARVLHWESANLWGRSGDQLLGCQILCAVPNSLKCPFVWVGKQDVGLAVKIHLPCKEQQIAVLKIIWLVLEDWRDKFVCSVTSDHYAGNAMGILHPCPKF